MLTRDKNHHSMLNRRWLLRKAYISLSINLTTQKLLNDAATHTGSYTITYIILAECTILVNWNVKELFSELLSSSSAGRCLVNTRYTRCWVCQFSSVLLSSRKVLVLEEPRGPIYKSLSSDFKSLSLSSNLNSLITSLVFFSQSMDQSPVSEYGLLFMNTTYHIYRINSIYHSYTGCVVCFSCTIPLITFVFCATYNSKRYTCSVP